MYLAGNPPQTDSEGNARTKNTKKMLYIKKAGAGSGRSPFNDRFEAAVRLHKTDALR